jgi:hypothetical protein
VAQGFGQQPGIDYAISFAPVVKFTTIRLLLAIAGYNLMWHLKQANVNNAYLHSNKDPNNKVFMKQPKGYKQGNAGNICKILFPPLRSQAQRNLLEPRAGQATCCQRLCTQPQQLLPLHQGQCAAASCSVQ